MRQALETWLCNTLCALGCAGCLADLQPDVGALKEPASDTGEAAAANGGGSGSSGSGANASAGNGSGTGGGSGTASGGNGSAGNGSAGNGSAGNGGGSDGGAWTDGGPGMPEPPDSSCAIKDSNPHQDVSFAHDVWPIFAGCRCHNPDSDDPLGILEVNFTIGSYASLRKGGDNTGENVIIAGNACDSIILKKLSETPPFGDRMPQDGPYLSLDVRTLISDWITEGARDN